MVIELTGLFIDECGWVKKGDKSVGVGHLYFGNVGKTANSRVAVFGRLCNGKYASLVDSRLYLPGSWRKDITKCNETGIPVDERGFKTKQNIARYTEQAMFTCRLLLFRLLNMFK